MRTKSINFFGSRMRRARWWQRQHSIRNRNSIIYCALCVRVLFVIERALAPMRFIQFTFPLLAIRHRRASFVRFWIFSFALLLVAGLLFPPFFFSSSRIIAKSFVVLFKFPCWHGTLTHVSNARSSETISNYLFAKFMSFTCHLNESRLWTLGSGTWKFHLRMCEFIFSAFAPFYFFYISTLGRLCCVNAKMERIYYFQ